MFASPKFIEKVNELLSTELGAIKGFTQNTIEAILDITNECFENAEEQLQNETSLAEKMFPLWDTIHWNAMVSDNEKNPQLYYDLLENMKKWHPCKDVCRKHMRENLAKLDPRKYESKFKHSVDFHNIVNAMTGKPSYNYEKAYKKYALNDCKTCTFSSNIKENAQISKDNFGPITGSYIRMLPNNRHNGSKY